MKKKAFKRKRNILNVLAVLVMLMAMLLTACSSGKTDAAPASEEASAAEADKEAELAEQAKEEAAEPEPTAEPTPEPTPEAVVYEGIDMESTLPGLEWMATFDELDVKEPIIVVYNDDTNKKVIVSEGNEVEFSKSSDILAIYTPNIETINPWCAPGGFNRSWSGSNELPDALTATRVIFCSKGVTSNDTELKCTLMAECYGEEKEYHFVLKLVDDTADQEKVGEELTEDPYAGIDMDSTLPGLEWIATFDGIIKEPTAVIYNDETNKKIIVKEGDEVEFSRTKDTLALYSPNIKTMTIITTVGNFYNGWMASEELPDAATSTRQIICEKDVCAKGDTAESVFTALYRGEEKEYKFTLKFIE